MWSVNTFICTRKWQADLDVSRIFIRVVKCVRDGSFSQVPSIVAPLITWEIKHNFRKLLLITLILVLQRARSFNCLPRIRSSLTSWYRRWKAIGYLPNSLSMSPLLPSLERSAGSSSKLPSIIQQITLYVRISIHNSWSTLNEGHVPSLILLGWSF